MRSLFRSSPIRGWVLGALGALVLLFGVATPSRAVLTSTMEMGSKLTTLINVLDPVEAVLAAPVAATVSRDGTGLLTHVDFASDVFSVVNFLVPVTDPMALPIVGVIATIANDVPDFNRAPSGKIGGLMPLMGVNKVCLFGPSCSAAGANLAVPISVVGKGGFATAMGQVNVTVVGAPWTQGTAAIGTITMMGNAANPTQMGTTMVGFTNDIQLVTPVFVSTNIPASAVVPVWGLLNFTIKSAAPEPGTIAAFGAAFISLVAVGVARRR